MSYKVSAGGDVKAVTSWRVLVKDHKYNVVAEAHSDSGLLKVASAKLWWPYSLDQTNYGYMYMLHVRKLTEYDKEHLSFLSLTLVFVPRCKIHVLFLFQVTNERVTSQQKLQLIYKKSNMRISNGFYHSDFALCLTFR